jgi:hypothetical protein
MTNLAPLKADRFAESDKSRLTDTGAGVDVSAMVNAVVFGT